MKKKELVKMFEGATSVEDYQVIFENNPGLEDEILKLGKEIGIDTKESRELSELELEMVAGGLNLKKGVMVTLATLMVASSIAAPLSSTTKAHAATPTGNQDQVYVQNQIQARTGSGQGSTNVKPEGNSGDGLDRPAQNTPGKTDYNSNMEQESRNNTLGGLAGDTGKAALSACRAANYFICVLKDNGRLFNLF